MVFTNFDYELRDKLREMTPTKLQDIAKVYYEQKIKELEDFLELGVYEDEDEVEHAWDQLYKMNIGLAYFTDDEYSNYIINVMLPKCVDHKLPLRESFEDYLKKLVQDYPMYEDVLKDLDEKDDLHKLIINNPDNNPDVEQLSEPLFSNNNKVKEKVNIPEYTYDYTNMDLFDGSTPYFDMMTSTIGDTCKCQNNCNCKEKAPNIKLNTESDKKNLEKYEMVQHPHHYNTYSVEVIDMFEKIYGPERVADWCEITALKYRLRMGTKPDNSIKQDLEKEEWYLKKAKELRDKIKK